MPDGGGGNGGLQFRLASGAAGKAAEQFSSGGRIPLAE